MNCNIHPLLYNWYLIFHKKLGATIVHRRKRRSNTCIEVIFCNDDIDILAGHLNTLKDAEQYGYWVICRPQTRSGRSMYKQRRVFQLFLSPVHPNKRTIINPISLPATAQTSNSTSVSAHE